MLKPTKAKKCRVCKGDFWPRNSFHVACGVECALTVGIKAAVKKAKQAQAAERKADKEKREQQKTISQLEEDCRKIVQKIARIRDRDDGCISCHVGPSYDGQWHGSHYRSHGGCSSLQFHLWNIHKSCAQCNWFKGGNREGYVQGLLLKPGYGRERIDWLDSQPKSKRFSREYLARFKVVMGKRLKRMEKWS